MTTENARVWDADNQERPEEPNAVVCFGHPDESPWGDAQYTAAEMAETIWDDVYAAEPVHRFDLIVEMPPGGSQWKVRITVDWTPDFSAGEATEVKEP